MTRPTPTFPAGVWDGFAAGGANDGDVHSKTDADRQRTIEEVRALQADGRSYGVGVIEVITPNSATDTDVTVPYNIRVLDVVAVKIVANGSTSDAVTVKNGSNPITNAMSLNINDQVLVRATSLNDAYQDVDAGGVLRATTAKTTDCQSVVRVYYKKR